MRVFGFPWGSPNASSLSWQNPGPEPGLSNRGETTLDRSGTGLSDLGQVPALLHWPQMLPLINRV